SERVEFYAIEPPSLHELLDPELQHLSRFTCTPDEASQGFLAIQSNLSIGCGTFKNAHRGWITLHHLRDAVLGTTKSELVVVKRTFRELSKKSGGQTAYTRYSSPEEHKIILKEANNLYWAIYIEEVQKYHIPISTSYLRSFVEVYIEIFTKKPWQFLFATTVLHRVLLYQASITNLHRKASRLG
ncbi:hypothetical protein R3P38DRAFT_2650594, partial [Favolaschia claudopus]